MKDTSLAFVTGSKNFFFLFFLLLLLTFSQVSAIGVSPPKITEEFFGGQERVFEYVIINNGNPSKASVEVYGSPLSQYVEIEETEFDLPKGLTKLNVKLTLPKYEDLPDAYGRQIIKIFIGEKPLEGVGGGFSAVTAVEAWLVINVPVPGEYGQITEFSVPTVTEGFNTEARLSIRNRGTVPLQNKRTVVEIKNVAGDVIDTQTLSGITLSVDQEKKFVLALPATSYESAKYVAEASFYFDEQKLPTQKATTFFVGSTDIELAEYTKILEEGKINRVSVTVQSLWGDSLRNVRGFITDFSDREQSLPVIDLEPYQQSTVQTFIEVPYLNESPFFVNTSEQKNLTVTTTLRLQFPVGETADETKEIPITFVIVQPEPKEVVKAPKEPLSTITLLIIGLSSIIVLLLIFVLIMLFKKNGKENNTKKTKNPSKHK